MTTAIPVVLGILIGIPVLIAIIVLLVVPIFKAIWWIISRIFRFIGAEIADAFRLLGSVITGVVYLPLTVFNVLLGRWSRAQHYGKGLSSELQAAGASIYRMAIGHPLRLFGAQSVVEGLEQRIPAAVAAAPPGTSAELRRGAAQAGGNVPSGRAGQFPGYSVIGTLPGGGSGGKLYVARPDATKMSAFQRQGFGPVGDVVIKSFSMGEGSALPQIVRENRALEAARKLGLVLEHELTNERFYYVMRYVPGDSLGVLTPRLHALGGGAGLPTRELASALGFGCDLLGTLHEYHRAGLWHKDVKPDNIIVANGHAHLVDFGLVTPLRSSMTLTTHGTEYFRDPEMVRLALRGVKVHEVDGAKFDIYAAGAVLFSMIENSFPAHGGLSQITRSCPEALRWIVRRAMTDYDKRYPSAQAMLADLAVVHQAALAGDATSVRPADLPSVKAGEGVESLAALVAGPDGALPHAPPAPPVGRWHGAPAMSAGQAAAFKPAGAEFGAAAAVAAAGSPRVPTRSAKDQLASARARVAEMRRRAHTRMGRTAKAPTKANFGVALAALTVVMATVGGLALMFTTLSPRAADEMHRAAQELARELADDTRVSLDAGEVKIDEDESAVFTSAPQPPEPPTAPERPQAPQVSTTESTTISGNRTTTTKRTATVSSTSPKSSKQSSKDTPPPAPAKLDKYGQGQTVLLMQEPAGYGEDSRAEIKAATQRLIDRGYTLISGDVAPDDAEAAKAAGARYVELAGSLRNAVGLRELGSPDAARSVNQWLGEKPDVHAVVWIVPDRDSQTPRVLKLVYTPATAAKDASTKLRQTVSRR